ncbi:Nicotinic receptor-associated protein 1 [Diplonema papillatum]|nr:Nicotinic receptor-associated protein 1 [Diplonema papillatum]
MPAPVVLGLCCKDLQVFSELGEPSPSVVVRDVCSHTTSNAGGGAAEVARTAPGKGTTFAWKEKVRVPVSFDGRRAVQFSVMEGADLLAQCVVPVAALLKASEALEVSLKKAGRHRGFLVVTVDEDEQYRGQAWVAAIGYTPDKTLFDPLYTYLSFSYPERPAMHGANASMRRVEFARTPLNWEQMSGALSKYSTGKKATFFKNWRTRFCVGSRRGVDYYESVEDPAPKGSIAFDTTVGKPPYQVIREPNPSQHKEVKDANAPYFAVQCVEEDTTKNLTLLFKADTIANRDRWCDFFERQRTMSDAAPSSWPVVRIPAAYFLPPPKPADNKSFGSSVGGVKEDPPQDGEQEGGGAKEKESHADPASSGPEEAADAAKEGGEEPGEKKPEAEDAAQSTHEGLTVSIRDSDTGRVVAVRADVDPVAVLTREETTIDLQHGCVKLTKVHRPELPSIRDFLSKGYSVETVVGIDLSSSNGDSALTTSLHWFPAKPPSDAAKDVYPPPLPSSRDATLYLHVVQQILNALLPFSQLTTPPADSATASRGPVTTFSYYGYGAKLEDGTAAGVFPMNRVTKSEKITATPADAYAVAASAYVECLKRVQLFGPANWLPLLNEVEASMNKPENSAKYYFVTLLACSEPRDIREVMVKLVKLSSRPLTLAVFGVGGDPFQNLTLLNQAGPSPSMVCPETNCDAARNNFRFVRIPFKKSVADTMSSAPPDHLHDNRCNPFSACATDLSSSLCCLPLHFLDWARLTGLAAPEESAARKPVVDLSFPELSKADGLLSPIGSPQSRSALSPVPNLTGSFANAPKD